ncbi:hypothetical protein, partial [Gimesia chilikensis]|uniref:hypothetical protein n=1 Tax=Gimesia chilikensis TaxID=2605989 RepID=UPI001A7EFF20
AVYRNQENSIKNRSGGNELKSGVTSAIPLTKTEYQGVTGPGFPSCLQTTNVTKDTKIPCAQYYSTGSIKGIEPDSG